MQVEGLSFDELESLASSLGLELPIEQTRVWKDYQQTIPGRSHWGCVRLYDGQRTLALLSLFDFATHGYHYLRATHGPVWVETPGPSDEHDALTALATHIRAHDRRPVFMRLAVADASELTSPTLSTVPYDQTVVIDLGGGDDAILSRMKPRGRRDVRKALREAPITCADETDLAAGDFDPYYQVMCETGERDEFVPAPLSDYQGMIRTLGPDHCRVFAGRDEGGAIVTWSIVTVSGGHAVRYYAASRNSTRRLHVTDKLVFFECCALGERGCHAYDLMGIGSDFSPTLMGLNEFKTKFSKAVTPVAPDRDVALRPVLYRALTKARELRTARREGSSDQGGSQPREDLLPVIVGGDIGAYSLGRELHMAYQVRSVCLASAPIGIISKSSIFDVHPIDRMCTQTISQAVGEIARANPTKKVFVIGNTDRVIQTINAAKDSFPPNVSYAVPSQEVCELVSDKVRFQELCVRAGVDVPATEVVSLRGRDPIAPTAVAFPLVAKPACSAHYDHLYEQGFKKVYFMHAQDELDELWAKLRAVGFEGDFLVQELIGGDDTAIDCLTVYVSSSGKPTMFASAQVLLEDHAPTMLGNPVAMISRPRPDSWATIERLLRTLEDEGLPYRGFCNFDVKRDPKTGRTVFMDMNPRIGRGSFYVVAGGVNPMRCVVSDVIDGKEGKVCRAEAKGLFTLVPLKLLRRYLNDELRLEVDELVRAGKVFDPQRYGQDNGLRRMLDVELTERNQIRKFARYYPRPTSTSF